MAQEVYLVTASGDGWEISHHTEHFGPFRSKPEALRDAVTAATEAGKLSGNASVMVLDELGRIYTVWMYGRDTATLAATQR